MQIAIFSDVHGNGVALDAVLSVGLAYNHEQSEHGFRADPWAEYAVLTVAPFRLCLEFRRVPFDVGELVRAYHASGRPYAAEAVAQYGAVP